MIRSPIALALRAFSWIFLLLPPVVAAQAAPQDKLCRVCHPAVTTAHAAKDARAHAAVACVDCHAALKDFDATSGDEHATPVAKVQCAGCHAPQASEHSCSVHADKATCAQCHPPHAIGLAPVPDTAAACGSCHADALEHWRASLHAADPGNGRVAASCSDCHGKHDVRAKSDPLSRVYPLRLPDTCESCHKPDPSPEHPAPGGAQVQQYETSVHGQALRKYGLIVTATCASCHGAHDIRAARAEDAPTARKQIPHTCGSCHAGILATYLEGVHGAAFRAGSKDVPVCTDCHTEHAVRDPAMEGSSTSKALVAETCARCHASDELAKRYGFRSSVRSSWGSSYHGIATAFGDRAVANCASCHGFHDVLPSSDPRSRVNVANLDKTCGSCHVHASAAFARIPVHAVADRAQNPVPWWVQRIYAVLVTGMIAAFVLFILADLWCRLRLRMRWGPPDTQHVRAGEWPDEEQLVGKHETFKRMSLHGRLQHALLIVSFSLLVLTGLPVFLHDTPWMQRVIDLEGGFHLRSLLHRGAAFALIGLSLWHTATLLLSSGARGWFAKMMIRPRDVLEFGQELFFDVGLRKSRPAFGRYGLVEKLEYGAVVWGNLVMIATGAILWRPDWFLGWMPSFTFEVCRIVHGFEATLAFLAIIIWHMYHVHLRPGVFPMSRIWLDGRISREELRHHHAREYLELLKSRRARTPLLVLFALLALAGGSAAQDNAKCIECHATEGLVMKRDGHDVSLEVDDARFKLSVHKQQDCVACHTDLAGTTTFPHKKGLARVDCTECHDDDNGPVQAWRESTHGLRAAAGDKLAPLCQDCHGNHYITKLKDPNSAIAPFNVPAMCAQCHTEGSPVERTHALPEEQVFQRYKDSIHGKGLYEQGLTVTAVCTSCHTGHNVRPHTDPKSSIHKDKLVATCMKCHGKIEAVHRKVIGGELWEKEGSVPLCVECHSPHEIRKVFYDTNMANADCLRCHATEIKASSDGRSLRVDKEEHERSIHGRKSISCAQCHAGATPSLERSCSTIKQKVQCSTCHEGQVKDYDRGVHGQLHAKGDAAAPTCTTCHGEHGILEHKAAPDATPAQKELVRSSPIFSRNVPSLCARCHEEGGAAARRYLGSETHIIEKYSNSIHGKGLIESGLVVTAVCTDCHTAHKELPASDPDSTVHAGNIAATCGNCHDGIYEKFQKSIHSREGNPNYVQLRGMPPLPDCNDCHTTHTMRRTDLAEFKLGIMEQCGKCHDKITETYFETYHGKASSLGDTAKAKCYDCHGAHDILPPQSPASHLSPANIVGTCAKCHTNANAQFAAYLTHATHNDREKYPALYWVFIGMTALLVGTFAFFGLHTLVWLPRSWKLRDAYRKHVAEIGDSARQFRRFTPYQRGLHLTMILSFFGLAITGMMLKFSHSGWAHGLARFLGGIEGAGWIHRVCAIATFGYMSMHLVDVAKRFKKSKKSLRAFLLGPDSLVPKFSDIGEFVATMKWFLGRGPAPRYGRWTYWEKFDYMAVFWGVVIIGSTGLCLWFPELFTRVLPGWSINVATIIHSDEALLATGFIFTIHFFNTHFRPEKFPMDPVIFTGSMSLAELKHDRPELYERLQQSGELESHLVDAPSPAFSKVVRVFGMTALTIGLTLAALILYALIKS